MTKALPARVPLSLRDHSGSPVFPYQAPWGSLEVASEASLGFSRGRYG